MEEEDIISLQQDDKDQDEESEEEEEEEDEGVNEKVDQFFSELDIDKESRKRRLMAEGLKVYSSYMCVLVCISIAKK